MVADVGQRAVRSALRSGRLRASWTGVLIEADRALDRRTLAAAALFACGPEAVISGPTAAYLHGCTALDDQRTHVLLPYGLKPRQRAGLVVHHSDPFYEDIVELDQLRLLVLDRVLCDLLCVARPRDALAATDQALASLPAERREVFRCQLRERLARRPDPRGTVRAARLLGLATGRAESPPESWLLLMIVELGFPPPQANWPVHAPGGRVRYRLDLAWPELRIAVEYDGYAVHLDRQMRDASRAEDLRRRGWIVIRVTADDLSNSARLDAELRAAFRRRGCVI